MLLQIMHLQLTNGCTLHLMELAYILYIILLCMGDEPVFMLVHELKHLRLLGNLLRRKRGNTEKMKVFGGLVFMDKKGLGAKHMIIQILLQY